MSHRKLRRLERVPPMDQLMADVKAIGVRPLVESVEEHFAGYFNELGITLRLNEQASEHDVVVLRNSILQLIERKSSELQVNFTWQVSMYRGAEQIALIFPGDTAILLGHPLELIYKTYA